jgi:hypothetical protein
MAWHIRFGLFFRVIRFTAIRVNEMTEIFREKWGSRACCQSTAGLVWNGAVVYRAHSGLDPIA